MIRQTRRKSATTTAPRRVVTRAQWRASAGAVKQFAGHFVCAKGQNCTGDTWFFSRIRWSVSDLSWYSPAVERSFEVHDHAGELDSSGLEVFDRADHARAEPPLMVVRCPLIRISEMLDHRRHGDAASVG